MDTLALLGTALGLATLAGINLYLTVFVTGLAVRFQWIELAAQYEPLAILGDPVVISVAGVLFFLEFFADKVPWVDSLWDSVHTVIRPIGGALLAITVLGEANPVYDVIVGLLGGGMALTSHAAKTGTRLIANASPEPFSNIGLSLGEDALVLAGLAVIATNPVVALVLAVSGVALALWLLPKIFRTARAVLWFLWRRLAFLFGARETANPDLNLPIEIDLGLAELHGEDSEPVWSAPCVAGRGIANRGNTFGWLILSESAEARSLDFVTKAGADFKIHPVVTDDCKISQRNGLISDRLIIYRRAGDVQQTLQFDRSRRGLVNALVGRLQSTTASTADTPSLREATAAS